jgi:hypothetical protein
VNDSEYNNFTGQKPIQCAAVFISFPLARAQKQEKRISPFLYAPSDQLCAFPLKNKEKKDNRKRKKRRVSALGP